MRIEIKLIPDEREITTITGIRVLKKGTNTYSDMGDPDWNLYDTPHQANGGTHVATQIRRQICRRSCREFPTCSNLPFNISHDEGVVYNQQGCAVEYKELPPSCLLKNEVGVLICDYDVEL